MSEIIIFEGTDFSGKSTIAKRFAEILNIPYYKNSAERVQKVQLQTKEMAKITAPIVIDLLKLLDAKIVMDRFIASEWVYSQVDGREYDPDVLKILDHELAELNAITIICYKTTYVGYVDESTPEDRLPTILEKYREYAEWSEIKRIFFLDTTDCDIERQITDILTMFSEYELLTRKIG